MAAQPNFIDTAVPFVLIAIVIGFLWSRFGKHFIKLFEWIKEQLKSKRHKSENPNSYEYIDYQ